MSLQPYDHDHCAVCEISWPELGRLLTELAERINQAGYRPEVVVGIAKGGVIPAVFLASALLIDFFPIKLSSRKNEQIVFEQPVWHVYPPAAVRRRRVLLVDDICVAGRTLSMASGAIRRRGAAEVRTATLASHDGGSQPDYCALTTAALIVWPWDRDVLSAAGQWSLNPEYLAHWPR